LGLPRWLRAQLDPELADQRVRQLHPNIDYNNNASGNLSLRVTPTGRCRNAACKLQPGLCKIWQIGTRTAWTPVQNLTFSGEVMYTNLDQSMSGVVAAAAGAMGTFKPAGNYNYADQGIWSGNLRVRRTW
jgi:hypothetical protein